MTFYYIVSFTPQNINQVVINTWPLINWIIKILKSGGHFNQHDGLIYTYFSFNSETNIEWLTYHFQNSRMWLPPKKDRKIWCQDFLCVKIQKQVLFTFEASINNFFWDPVKWMIRNMWLERKGIRFNLCLLSVYFCEWYPDLVYVSQLMSELCLFLVFKFPDQSMPC